MRFVFVTFFNENIFYTEKSAILKVYFRKSLISQLLLGIFQKKFVDKINLTSSIHFWCQIPGNTSKSIRKFCKIWLFWELHRQFPRKPEVLQQNGYDLRNQHPSISQKRVFWSLHFTKNLKIETCVIGAIWSLFFLFHEEWFSFSKISQKQFYFHEKWFSFSLYGPKCEFIEKYITSCQDTTFTLFSILD